ncbi:hypothetical protein [Pseudochrobactrum sp. MP213Fo]|uniref:hypothetical protein n=1 Tax=Pseudochrobactrum sp. MP213Fo TaxID=3022250 RepID=UPI003BA35B13
MVSVNSNTNKSQLLKLSDVIREEQKRLLDEAADFDSFPNKGLLRQIAELELAIVAVDNYLADLDDDSDTLSK